MPRILVVLALLAVASPAVAQTAIDFDDLSVSSCVYSSAPMLDTQYAVAGVTFSGDISNFPVVVPSTCLTISGASAPNIVAISGGGRYLRADFSPSVRTVSIGVGNYNRVETFTLTAYDLDGAVLASSTLTPPYRVFGTISVTAAGTSSVVLTALHSENAVDDLFFSNELIDGGVEVDAATIDAAVVDAAVIDAAVIDAAVIDAAVIDAAMPDAAVRDASALDASVRDAATSDAGSIDAGARDAALSPDAGTVRSIGRSCGCRAGGSRGSRSAWLFLALGLAVAIARLRGRSDRPRRS